MPTVPVNMALWFQQGQAYLIYTDMMNNRPARPFLSLGYIQNVLQTMFPTGYAVYLNNVQQIIQITFLFDVRVTDDILRARLIAHLRNQ